MGVLASLSWSTASGAKVKWTLADMEELRKFDGLKRKSRRKGPRPRYYLVVHMPDGETVWRADEVLYCGGRYSTEEGAFVTFELDSPETLLTYRELRVADEISEGEPRLLTVFEVAEDGTLVDQAIAALDEAPKLVGGPVSKHAGMMCREPEFIAFVAHVTANPTCTESQATDWLRAKCQIQSRAELDHDDAAKHRFKVFVEGPYIRFWTQRQLQ